MELWLAFLLLLALGAVAGFLAGLFGIGGGAVLVPGIFYILMSMGYGAHAMHVAVGTSLASIIFTGLSSARAHYKRDAVDMALFKSLLPGVFAGVVLGSVLAGQFDTWIMKVIFASSSLFFGSYMLIFGQRAALFSAMPPRPVAILIETVVATIATLKGVGGGVQNVIFQTLCGRPIHNAIGTASCWGAVIALSGSLGYVLIGWGLEGLPPLSLGYVNVAALGAIILSSVVMAPVGAHVAHALPVRRLKKVFSVFLLLIAVKMLVG